MRATELRSGPLSAERALTQKISIGGETKVFGDLTAAELHSRGEELSESSGLGHGGGRIAGVAMNWRSFAKILERAGAERVSDLDDATVNEYAEKLWVVPPGGSMF